EREPGHRLPAAFIDRPRPIGDSPSALDDLADRRMVLPALEFLERADPGIGIVERGHETERHLPVGLVIEEPAAPGVVLRKRPALRMDDPPGLMPVGRYFP